MPEIPEPIPVAPLFVRDDDEGLFSRDINGQLVRLDAPTEADYSKNVTLQIDGQSVTVPLSRPLKDANGNVILDIDDRSTPRYTTIYDAALELYSKHEGDNAKIPIPLLCHLPHMTPVAVCRLCVVQIYGQKRGQRAAERKLLPACQHQVKEGMEVFTMNAEGPDGDRVRQSVKVVTEMLAVDHLKPAPQPTLANELEPYNELGQITKRCGAVKARLDLDVFSLPPPAAPPNAGRRKLDPSSPVFLVDHSACVLCDRCVRACDEVMENNVIGRTGKGATAGIGFDLNDEMGKSSCVQCGECMISCPTTAITFKPVAKVKISTQDSSAEILPAAELLADKLFEGVPPKFLLWQQGLAVRRRLKQGDFLCRQTDPGNTAFIIREGKFVVDVYPTTSSPKGQPIVQRKTATMRIELTPKDIIVGEMACLSGTPRAADVSAMGDGEVWEIRRNVLDRLMRVPSQRPRFEEAYRERVLQLVLGNSELFKAIDPAEFKEIVAFMRERLSFVSMNPHQTLFRQGDRVTDLYFVRLGYIRVGVRRFEGEARVLSLGPGNIIGEIGALAFSTHDVNRTLDEADQAMKEALEQAAGDLENALPPGVRTATCSALGGVELARLRRKDFLELLLKFPVLRRRFVHLSLTRLRRDLNPDNMLPEYVSQGLYEGRSLLVLDMDLCTRCDECTKGCVEQHGSHSHGVPITRLLRDGMRFDNYTVATSCRSCVVAHCMVGCPVDAIHRGKHLQIVIEDHCIGCGLCASNCPYGSIFMMPDQTRDSAAHSVIAHPKAATCDLCDAEGDLAVPRPQCVASCPHEAAERISGEDLLARVSKRFTKKR